MIQRGIVEFEGDEEDADAFDAFFEETCERLIPGPRHLNGGSMIEITDLDTARERIARQDEHIADLRAMLDHVTTNAVQIARGVAPMPESAVALDRAIREASIAATGRMDGLPDPVRMIMVMTMAMRSADQFPELNARRSYRAAMLDLAATALAAAAQTEESQDAHQTGAAA